jgi:hypothetical protein
MFNRKHQLVSNFFNLKTKLVTKPLFNCKYNEPNLWIWNNLFKKKQLDENP